MKVVDIRGERNAGLVSMYSLHACMRVVPQVCQAQAENHASEDMSAVGSLIIINDGREHRKKL